MGCRQVARQRFLEPLFVGSNPATPAKRAATKCPKKNLDVIEVFRIFEDDFLPQPRLFYKS